jgi:hypothetical protein
VCGGMGRDKVLVVVASHDPNSGVNSEHSDTDE